MEFLQGLQMTSICNQPMPCSCRVDFIDHHFSILPEVVAIEDSIAQFPEGSVRFVDFMTILRLLHDKMTTTVLINGAETEPLTNRTGLQG